MTVIHALILAGGRGSRMGGVDKGLQLLEGRPLVAHVIERLAPQAASLLISANRNLDAYAALGHRVLADPPGLEFAGPLAGMLAGLEALPDDAWLLTAPCDCPRLPAWPSPRRRASTPPTPCCTPACANRSGPIWKPLVGPCSAGCAAGPTASHTSTTKPHSPT